MRIASLTPGVAISTWRSDATATLIQLSPTEGRRVANLARLYPYAAAVSLDAAAPAGHTGDFSRFQPQYNDQLMGSQVIFESYFLGPRFANLGPDQAAALQYKVDLPAGKPLVLRFSAALSSITPEGQNAHLRVTIDGRDVFDTLNKSTLWEEYAVPFTASASGTTPITLAMMPEAAGQTPRVLWRGMRVTEAGGAENVDMLIQSDQPLGNTGEDGRLIMAKDTQLTQQSFDPVVLFGTKPTRIDAETELTGLPFTFGTEGAGIYAPGMSAYGSGVVEKINNGQGAIVGLFNAHPPSSGQTVFRQAVTVGQTLERPVLTFQATVREGALTQGVGFELRLNGRLAWHWSTDKAGQKEGAVALDDYRGKPLLIEWVSDSLGENSFDWAQWIDPRIGEAQ